MIKKNKNLILQTFSVILLFTAIYYLLNFDSLPPFSNDSNYNKILSSLIIILGALVLVFIFVIGFYNLIKFFTFLFTKLLNNSTLSKSSSKLLQFNNYFKSSNFRNPKGVFKVFFITTALSFIFSFIFPDLIQSIFLSSIIATLSFYLLPFIISFFILIINKTRSKIIDNRKKTKEEAANEFDNFRYLK